MAQFELHTTQIALLEALKASLFDIEPNYPEDTDWSDVIKEAKSQAVFGIVSPVIPISDVSTKQGLAKFIKLLYEQDKLIKLLEENDIPCVILKGCAVAVYYPEPHLRAMGDVDILVQHDKFESAMAVLEANGYVYHYGKDKDGNRLENQREVSYFKSGIEFELHHHFSSYGFDIDDILEDAITRREYRDIQGYKIPVLPDIENGLVLLGHINHHLKDCNLGLRQILDWEMYVAQVLDQSLWNDEFEPILKNIGLEKLAVNVTRMCVKYLGLPDKIEFGERSTDDVSDVLLNILFDSGNFGRKDQSTKYERRVQGVSSSIKRKGIFRFLQDLGLYKGRYCKKYRILRPFAWIYGSLYFCKKSIIPVIKNKTIRKQISKSNEKYELARKIGVRGNEK